jgi:hypothetical protein
MYRLAFLLPLLPSLALLPTSTGAPEPDDPPAFLVLPYLQLPTPTGMTVLWETNRKQPGKVEYGTTAELGQTAEEPKEKLLHAVALTGLKPATTYHYRVRSGDLVSETYTFKTAPPPGTKRWKMALYGDSRSNPGVHAKIAEGMYKAGVDLIVHTGDIVFNGKNHDSWRKEFFEPLGPLARSVPWISTLGNHERDSDEYFSYVRLPGNGHYFGFDYASAHFICLDSNSWVEKGRDSKQGRWLVDELARKRDASWTFAVFHHSLFSAHVSRPVEPLRWDWAPLLLDPTNKVDAVLTGHDHFYSRNYRMGRLAEKPQPGVLFMTSAGGGAPLYRTKQRDFVAVEKSVHNFEVFAFDGDEVTITAHDVAGKQIDRYKLTKDATPAEEFCAYEVEELRHTLRQVLTAATPIQVDPKAATTIDTALAVPTTFAVPVRGTLQWRGAEAWRLTEMKSEFTLTPGQKLRIPVQAELAAGPFSSNPVVTIAFEPGRFRNRTLELSPFLLAGPERVTAATVTGAVDVDGKLDEKSWQTAGTHALLGLPPVGGRADRVSLVSDRKMLYLGARLDDPEGKVTVKTERPEGDGGRVVLSQEHVGLILTDGKVTHTFALTPEQLRYYDVVGADEVPVEWKAAAAKCPEGWSAELAVPRALFADWSGVRVNVTHRRGEGKASREFHLCPSYTFGNDPDRIEDANSEVVLERLARLTFGER